MVDSEISQYFLKNSILLLNLHYILFQNKNVSSKKRRYKPHTGRLPSAGLKNLTESLEESEMKMYQQQFESPPKTPDPDMLQMPASCHSILKVI